MVPRLAIFPQVTFEDIKALCRAHSLDIFGAFHPRPEDGAPEGCKTLILLGPHEPGFWATLTRSSEWREQDPVDRWSERVIGDLAQTIGGEALFPFGGPPYQPFIRWAQRSGSAWASPVTILVQARAGLMVSYRGAIALRRKIDLPTLPTNPCDTCEKPCLTACPVGALSASGYDVDACHAFLDTEDGSDCLKRGCAVRRACPVSQTYGRVEEQSSYHMSVFHK